MTVSARSKLLLNIGLYAVAFGLLVFSLDQGIQIITRKMIITFMNAPPDAPTSITISARVTTRLFGTRRAWQISLKNGSGADLHNAVVEVDDGWTCPIQRFTADGDGTFSRGEEALILYDRDQANTDGFRYGGLTKIISELPKSVVLRSDGATYRYTIPWH